MERSGGMISITIVAPVLFARLYWLGTTVTAGSGWPTTMIATTNR